jgi:histidine triad (HIT) family protein
MASLFTKIIKGEIPSSKVAEGAHYYAFLDINPRRAGHTLVVPKEQQQYVAALSADSRAGIMEGIVEVQRKLGAHFGTTDFQVNCHDGPIAGQEVPHVHFHVLPRTEGDGGKSMLAMWPNAPPFGSVAPDFGALAKLAEDLQKL